MDHEGTQGSYDNSTTSHDLIVGYSSHSINHSYSIEKVSVFVVKSLYLWKMSRLIVVNACVSLCVHVCWTSVLCYKALINNTIKLTILLKQQSFTKSSCSFKGGSIVTFSLYISMKECFIVYHCLCTTETAVFHKAFHSMLPWPTVSQDNYLYHIHASHLRISLNTINLLKMMGIVTWVCHLLVHPS